MTKIEKLFNDFDTNNINLNNIDWNLNTLQEKSKDALIFSENTFKFWELVKEYWKLPEYKEKQEEFVKWIEQFLLN